MSPRTVLLILVIGSAAASTKYSSSSGNMIRSVVKNNLDMALALSRLPSGAMSTIGRYGRLVGIYQSRARSTAPVIGENKNGWNARKGFKVCAKCPPPMWLFSFRTAVMNQALKEHLTINQGKERISGITVNSRIRLL